MSILGDTDLALATPKEIPEGLPIPTASIEISVCKHCGRQIRHTFTGKDGWRHYFNDVQLDWHCALTDGKGAYAEPKDGVYNGGY